MVSEWSLVVKNRGSDSKFINSPLRFQSMNSWRDSSFSAAQRKVAWSPAFTSKSMGPEPGLIRVRSAIIYRIFFNQQDHRTVLKNVERVHLRFTVNTADAFMASSLFSA
jgi:hypothetical protein